MPAGEVPAEEIPSGRPVARRRAAPTASIAARALWSALACGAVLSCNAGRHHGRPRLPQNPRDPAADVAQARAAYAAGRYEEAAQRWAGLFWSTAPGSERACAEGTRAWLALDDLDSARELVEAGLERHAKSAELLELRGNVLERAGFRRAAEKSYEAALEEEPERTSALFSRARLRLELGLATSACADLEACLQQGASGGDVWLCYARALAVTGRPRAAFDSFARAFEQGHVEQRCLVAAAGLVFDESFGARSARDRQLAEAWLARAANSDPRDAQAHYLLALLQEERGDVAQARASLERALSGDPAHLPCLEKLAELCHAAGERERCAEYARRALEYEQRLGKRAQLEGYLRDAPSSAPAPPADSD